MPRKLLLEVKFNAFMFCLKKNRKEKDLEWVTNVQFWFRTLI